MDSQVEENTEVASLGVLVTGGHNHQTGAWNVSKCGSTKDSQTAIVFTLSHTLETN